MNIGIIGAGHIGSTLAGGFVKLGHQVVISNSRGPATLAEVAARTGAKAVTAKEAAAFGEVVILTIPEKNVPQLPKDTFAGARPDAIIVDTGNYYPELRDGRIGELEAGTPDSQWVAQHLGRPVLKAFNNIIQPSLAAKGAPRGTPGRIALSVAGDAPAAKAVVLKLIDDLGFDPVDGGTLAESWRQQVGTPAYCRDLDAATLTRALAEATRERIAEDRANGERDAMRRIAARQQQS